MYRLAQVSVDIIDQCAAQGVPFARGVRRSARQPFVRWRPGEPHLLRPRPDPASSSCIGAYQALAGARSPSGKRRPCYNRSRTMLDIVTKDGRGPKASSVRDMHHR